MLPSKIWVKNICSFGFVFSSRWIYLVTFPSLSSAYVEHWNIHCFCRRSYRHCRKRVFSWNKDTGYWQTGKGLCCWWRTEEANYTSWYLNGLVIHAQGTSKEALALNASHSRNKDITLLFSDLQRQVHPKRFESCNTEIWFLIKTIVQTKLFSCITNWVSEAQVREFGVSQEQNPVL